MSAVAERIATTKSNSTSTSAQTRRVRRRLSRRRPLTGFRLAVFVGCWSLALILVLGWMSMYARLAVTGYDRSKLVSMYHQQQLINQRLKLKMNALSSPNGVVIAAQKAGMVYATNYDYIQKPQTLASASHQAGD